MGRRLAESWEKSSNPSRERWVDPFYPLRRSTAKEVARMISLPLDVIIVRKLQIPFESEAGFGALGPEGEVIFNDNLLKQLRLLGEEIDETMRRTLDIIRKRNSLSRAGRPQLKRKGERAYEHIGLAG